MGVVPTADAGARKQHRHVRLVEAKPSRSFTLPAVVLSGLVAGLFAWRRRRRHRVSCVPAVPQAELLAMAGAAAERRHRAYEDRQNRRAPRHDSTHRPGIAVSSASGFRQAASGPSQAASGPSRAASGPSQAAPGASQAASGASQVANTTQQRSFSHPQLGNGSSLSAQDAVPRVTRRRQEVQQETTVPGSTGSSTDVASSSRQGHFGALTDSAVTSTLDMILLQAALQMSDSASPGELSFSTASQTVQMLDEEEERMQNTDKKFVSEVDLALALALVQSTPWHTPSLDRPSAPNSNEADAEASAPPMSSLQAQALQMANLADGAGRNPTNDDTPQDEYDFWNPPQYQPAEPSQADLQLSPWETANVFDGGLQPHPGRAHLDTGNSSCTLIDSRFAKQLGLVNFDYRPTQAYSGTTRVTGVVHGVHIEVPIINIQYEIKGKRIYSRAGVSDQGSRSSWDLLISCNEIRLFESDGFSFSATRR